MTPGAPTPWGPPPPAYPVGQTAPAGSGGQNGLAIAALILGLLTPLCLVPGLVAMVLAVIALVQIRQRGQKGTGLAIGGIIATLLWIVVGFVVVIVLALNAGPVRNSNGEIVSAGRISVDDLRIGDCVNGLDQEGGVSRLDAVPCSQPHEGQVFATFDLPAGPWPGEDELFAMAEQGCHDRMETDLPEVYDDLSVKLFYLHPSEKLWRDGNREVICFAYHPEKRTGSVFD